MDPTSKDWCPCKDKETWRDPETHREKGHVMTEAVYKPRDAKDCQQPPEHKKKAGKTFFQTASNRKPTCNTLISDIKPPDM